MGSGVCFCAVCDGAFYKDKTVAVNGGGNSALQDALLLSEKCGKVYHHPPAGQLPGGGQAGGGPEAARENVEFL